MARARIHRPRRTSRAETYQAALHMAKHPETAASAAGLHYVSDEQQPGLGRRKTGRGFRYVGVQGWPVRDPATLGRIRSLVIPPAWTRVWISPDALGHIQATGRDARGRKQYRYHPRWRVIRDEAKYGRMLAFGQVLPLIRAHTEEDIARPGLSRRKVLAAVIRLLEATLIRVGNEEYARDNGSFGLTTFRDRHALVKGATVKFRFRGKSGKVHEIDVSDRRLSRIVKRCQDLPGQELFQYVDRQGQRRAVSSSDVNDYLREITGQEFTAKDFRTWAGTVLAAWALLELDATMSAGKAGARPTKAQAKRNVLRALEKVAGRLGNTVAVSRKCYVHPVVFDAYLDGTLIDTLQQRLDHETRAGEHHLQREEMAVLALLHQRLDREAAARTA